MPLYQPTAAGVSDHGALTGLADDDHTAYSTNAEFDDHSARHEDGGADEISIAALSGTPVAVTDHLNDATDAHDASAISVLDAATVFTAVNVETALKELYDGITAGGIPATVIAAKGDLIVGTANDTVGILTAGANGLGLVADSGETTGLKWAAPTGGLLQSGQAVRTAGDVTTTSTTFVDLTGMSVTITTGAHRCLIIANIVGLNSGVERVAADIDLDGSRLGQGFGLASISLAASEVGNLSFQWLTEVLSAASHTFKIQWKVSGGTGTIYASTTFSPAKLTVIETGLTA